jgi:hypothetical protein
LRIAQGSGSPRSIARWLSRRRRSSNADLFAMPPEIDEERARLEGWILGVREGRGGDVNRRNSRPAVFSVASLRRLSDDELLRLSRETQRELRRRRLDRAGE